MLYDIHERGDAFMDVSHLSENQHRLICFMEAHGYSSVHLRKVKKAIEFIVSCPRNSWASYDDVFADFCEAYPEYRRGQRTIINLIARFDLLEEFPDGGHMKVICRTDAYRKLNIEYQLFIDKYKEYCLRDERNCCKNTVQSKTSIGASFLYRLQAHGCETFTAAKDVDVIHLHMEDKRILKSKGYWDEVRRMLQFGISQNIDGCQKILHGLPAIRKRRKNIQYFSNEEVEAIRCVLESDANIISLRDKAIVRLLLHTGIRACDIARLCISSIDWENDLITIVQDKTDKPLSIPLRPVVGNAIYEYLEIERPQVDLPEVFLRLSKPYLPLKAGGIASITNSIYRIAGIRKNPHDRKGTHLFRHHFTSVLLENGTSQPVITNVLGHTSPKSIEPYLNTDMKHLKECAISIEEFPVPEEVFYI